MLDNNFYKELSEKLRNNSDLMQEYIVKERELLGKKQVLLAEKEKELDEVRKYLFLTASVVETLKQEVSVTVEQLKVLESEMLTGIQVSIGIEQDLDKLTNVKPVEITSNKEVKYSSVNSILSSLSDLKSESDTLSSNDLDDNDNENSENNIIRFSTSNTTVDDDIAYIKLIIENCKVPDDTSKLDIWKRRVLVKHYMEQGLSTINEVMERYNKYATHEQVALGTQSSISKDMKFIFDGGFRLEVLTYNKELQSTFRPASMLNSDEMCKINKLILGVETFDTAKYRVNTFISENNMSSYKTKAVFSFVKEQYN